VSYPVNALKLAVGDGAMGFWAARDEVYPLAPTGTDIFEADDVALVRPENVACEHLIYYVLDIFSHPVSKYQVGLGFECL
jgi:hypothetical protein